MHDCIIIGAGPAGLTAALYLGRFRRNVLVLHDQTARAERIPLTHNVPGFPEGISGTQLLARMSEHALKYGARIEVATVTGLELDGSNFIVSASDGRAFASRSVILATGILLNQVDLPHEVHEQAIEDDVLRYCAICDAYEHIDRKIAVVGYEESGASQALFLGRYSNDVHLIPENPEKLEARDRAQLERNGITISQTSMTSVEARPNSIAIWKEGNSQPSEFDVLYPCFGTRARTELAQQLGLAVDDSGCLTADSHFGTKIAGFYAAGDVVEGLDQISVAMGHGAIAATKAHTLLRELEDAI